MTLSVVFDLVFGHLPVCKCPEGFFELRIVVDGNAKDPLGLYNFVLYITDMMNIDRDFRFLQGDSQGVIADYPYGRYEDFASRPPIV